MAEMEKAKEVAFLLNTLRETGMGDIAPNSNWREMIDNYFYSGIAFDEDSEDEESAMGVDDSSTPTLPPETSSGERNFEFSLNGAKTKLIPALQRSRNVHAGLNDDRRYVEVLLKMCL